MDETPIRRARAADLLRTLAALAAILPGMVVGAWTAIRTGDRRRGLNRATELWGSLGTRAAGIRLRVQGSEHLELRPAVFVINHQSGIDPILICALLKRNFVGVAKAEIRRNPLLGPAFSLVDTIFLDRQDGPGARANLGAGVETLAAGLAVAIAPEGTRSARSGPGRFKGGAFRLAIAARVPLVPIVIHDAGRILPRGARVMRGGPVHVSVKPPMPTADWRVETLEEHIDAVEAIFERTLSRGTEGASPGR